MTGLPGSEPDSERAEGFTPEQLDRTVLAIPLIKDLRDEQKKLKADPTLEPRKWDVVLDINLEFATEREEARAAARKIVTEAIAEHGVDKQGQGIGEAKSGTSQYLFAALEGDVIRDVVDRNEAGGRPIFRVWPDFEIQRL
jgi:hypothetical protein